MSPLLEDKPVTLCYLDLQLLASCSLNSIAEARASSFSCGFSLSDVGLYHLSSHRAELLRLQAALLVCAGAVRDEGSKEHNSVHQVTGMHTVSARFTTMAVLCSKVSIDKASIARLAIIFNPVHRHRISPFNMLLKLVYFSVLAALQVRSETVGYFDSDFCADGSGLEDCYAEADSFLSTCITDKCAGGSGACAKSCNGDAACIQRNCPNLGIDCMKACECVQLTKQIQCAAESCWNQVSRPHPTISTTSSND